MLNIHHRSVPRYPTVRQTLVSAGLDATTARDGANFRRAFNTIHTIGAAIWLPAQSAITGVTSS
jgi:hypothetical protein